MGGGGARRGKKGVERWEEGDGGVGEDRMGVWEEGMGEGVGGG